MSISTIITLVTYILFFLILISGFLWGLKRGVVKSSIRIGTLIGFIIIAGLITLPISKALLTIDLSSFGWQIKGELVTNIPDTIKNLVLSIPQVADAAAEMPSLMNMIEALPAAAMNIVVFFLLIFIMQFFSWLTFFIISKTALKESRLARKEKKRKRLEAKNGADGQLAKPDTQTALAPKKKKHRLLGALVGTVQGFILMFLIFLPITSLAGTVTEIASTATAATSTESSSSTPMVVYADGGQFLSETSGDLLHYYIGDEILSYISAYSNSVPGKILTIGGFDDVAFDAITTVSVNDEGFAFRHDIASAAKIYDEVVYLLDEVSRLGDYSKLDFDRLDNAVEALLNMGLFNSLMEDAVPYGLTYFYDSDAFLNLPYNTDIKDALDTAVVNLKSSENGFSRALKNDLSCLVEITKTACKQGLVDVILAGDIQYAEIIDIVKKDNYSLLNSVSQNLFNSETLQIIFGKGSNVGLALLSDKLKDDGSLNLGEVNYSAVNWQEFKSSFNNIVRNALDAYDILEPYEISEVIANPKIIISEEFSVEDFSNLISIIGKELNAIKTSPLFSGQTTIKTYDALIDYVASIDPVANFLDASSLKATNLETELNYLKKSFVDLKESGILNYILDESTTPQVDVICEMLLGSAEDASQTYVVSILTPIVNSPITQKTIKFGLEKVNEQIPTLKEKIGDGVMGIDLSEFTGLSRNDKNAIVNLAESFAYFVVNVGYQEFIDDTLTAIFKLNDISESDPGKTKIYYVSDFLTKLQQPTIIHATYLSIFDSLATHETYGKYFKFNAVNTPDFSWSQEFNAISNILNLLEKEIDSQSLKEILFPTNSIDDLNTDSTTIEAVLTHMSKPYNSTQTSINVFVNDLYSSQLLKKTLVFVLNTLNSSVADIISTETEPVTITEVTLVDLTAEQKDDAVRILDALAVAYTTLISESFDLASLTDDEIVKIGTFLNELRYNAYDCDATGIPNAQCVLSTSGKDVENGGIFAELYIALVDYAKDSFEFSASVSYGTIEWINFLSTAKKLSDLAAGSGDILEVLSDPDSGVDIGDALEVIGVEEETANKITDIQDSFTNIDGDDSQSYSDLADSLGSVTQEDIDSIIETVEAASGSDLTGNIDASVIAKEQAVSARISLLMSNINSVTGTADGITDANCTESLNDLCNGAIFVLQQAISNGTVLNCTMSGGETALTTAINNATSDTTVRALVKTLFGIGA